MSEARHPTEATPEQVAMARALSTSAGPFVGRRETRTAAWIEDSGIAVQATVSRLTNESVPDLHRRDLLVIEASLSDELGENAPSFRVSIPTDTDLIDAQTVNNLAPANSTDLDLMGRVVFGLSLQPIDEPDVEEPALEPPTTDEPFVLAVSIEALELPEDLAERLTAAGYNRVDKVAAWLGLQPHKQH